MKTLFALLTAAVVLLSLTTFGASAIAEDEKAAAPGDTVKKFVRAMEANDVKGVKEAMPQLGELLGDEKLKQMVAEASKEIKADGGVKSITIDKEVIKDDKATVTATIESGNGEKDTDDMELKKVDGKWVLYMDMSEKDPGQPGQPPAPEPKPKPGPIVPPGV